MLWKNWLNKRIIFLIFLIITTFILLMCCNFNFVKKAAQQELDLLYQITGSIIEEHPELEEDIILSLKNQNSRMGYDLLQKYGYTKDYYKISNSDFYVSFNIMNFLLISLFCIFIFAIWYIQSSTRKKYRNQLKEIESTVEHYKNEYIKTDAITNSDLNIPELIDLEQNINRLGEIILFKNQAIHSEKEKIQSLITDLAHQLKTPVASLNSCYSILVTTNNSEEKQEFMVMLGHQIDKLTMLISSLVDLSRLETTMIKINKKEISTNNLILNAVNSIYIEARKKNIDIEILNNDYGHTVFVDKKWTHEAIFNVLDNAVKYSSPSSIIQIATETFPSHIRINITDHSFGIPKSEQNLIFKRFYRGTYSDIKEKAGIGVGLYLTRLILEMQGGDVTVKSISNEGSTFSIILPKL